MGIVATPGRPVFSSVASDDNSCWRESLRRAFRDSGELGAFLGLPRGWENRLKSGDAEFPLFVPREYAARMRRGDLEDPLLRQVLPLAIEDASQPLASLDPVGDAQAQRLPGLLQKYRSRVLLVVSGACAIHCRYCFRRHFSYATAPHSLDQWAPAFAEIEQDTSLREVILSGGDPWMLVDELLARLIQRLAEIKHLVRLRIHTRLPIVVPQRVTESLLAGLTSTRLTPVVVIHANHAAELDAETSASIARLRAAGVTLLNQAVLLRGVNDCFASQHALCERLVDNGVLPYYLHQLDRVAGAMHFEVPIDEGRKIMAQLREHLPGYAVPRYVQEIAGEAHKRILA
ncbi:MAG: EF-P beta-lysylation protein EpmB [Planctomycetales bacterium]|nr:EF-P beta-lysylation protein EpmB [Planctomycetales bacterium]